MGGNGSIHAQTAINAATSSVRPGEPVTLNFANADIEAIARTMATITGKSVVVDPRISHDVKTITLSYTFFEVGGRALSAPQAALSLRGTEAGS